VLDLICLSISFVTIVKVFNLANRSWWLGNPIELFIATLISFFTLRGVRFRNVTAICRAEIFGLCFFSLLHSFAKKPLQDSGILVLIWFGIVFGPLAYLAARSGHFTQRRWWIVLPFWPLIYALAHPRIILSRIVLSFILIVVAILILSLMVSTITIIWIWKGSHLEPIYSVVNIVLVSSIAIYSLLSLGRWFYYQVHDRYLWYKWSRNYDREMYDGIALCKAVGKYRNWRLAARFLQSVRTRNVMLATRENQIFLGQLSMTLTNKRLKREVRFDASPEVEGCAKLITTGNQPEIADEIAMLLEQVHLEQSG